ncbi:mevalonate kinase [Nocardia terpenica]
MIGTAAENIRPPVRVRHATRTHGSGSAPAKLILVGEHTVVHGAPAIAMPIPTMRIRASASRGIDAARPESMSAFTRRIRCDGGHSDAADSGIPMAVRELLRRCGIAEDVVEVELSGDVPLARGLGASAASTAAAVQAVADLYHCELDYRTRYELVQCGEQVAHGRASGVDTSAVLASGPILFQADTARPLEIGLRAGIVIADTGKRGNTRDAVARVQDRFNADRAGKRSILGVAIELAAAAREHLAAGETAALGEVLLRCQDLLVEMGVSTPEINRLIAAALDSGALGAKLTGGGLGGCVIALAEPDPALLLRLSTALRSAGAVRTWITGLGGAS